MGPLGIPEMIVIGVLALLIFGPRKLPELGRSVGRALAEFRRASNDIRATIEDEVRELERHTREATQEPPAGPGALAPPEPDAVPRAPEETNSADGEPQRP